MIVLRPCEREVECLAHEVVNFLSRYRMSGARGVRAPMRAITVMSHLGISVHLRDTYLPANVGKPLRQRLQGLHSLFEGGGGLRHPRPINRFEAGDRLVGPVVVDDGSRQLREDHADAPQMLPGETLQRPQEAGTRAPATEHAAFNGFQQAERHRLRSLEVLFDQVQKFFRRSFGIARKIVLMRKELVEGQRCEKIADEQ